MIKWLKRRIGKWTASWRDTHGWFHTWVLDGATTVSGENVSNDGALRIATVYACINNISQDIAKLPFNVYQRQGDSNIKRGEHPLYNILHWRSNDKMSAVTFRQILTAHVLGWGNGYAEIERDVYNKVAGLLPLRPDRVTPQVDTSGNVYYEVLLDNGEKKVLLPHEVFHIPGLGFDGLVGYNVIRYARECMGAARAAEKYGASFFGNGALPGGVLEHPGRLTEEAQKRLVDSWNVTHQGADKAHRIRVAEEGMKFNSISIPPEESQFLETREFTVPEICRWFRMPPHKVQDLRRATFSNIEQQSLEYVTDALQIWMVRWEQEAWRKLLTEAERAQGYFVEHVAEGLLRGDIKTRYEAYAQGRQWGWLSVNEIRRLENMNPVEEGDQYLVPMNMTTPEKLEQEPVETLEPVFDDMAARIYDNERRCVESSHNKHGDDFNHSRFVEKFLPKHRDYVNAVVSPLGIDIEIPLCCTKHEIRDAIKHAVLDKRYS